MPNKDRSFHESPEKAGGEGWLYSEQQQKLSLWLSFLLPMRGDDSARCPVLVQKDEALQALGAHLAKGAGLGT